MFTLQELQMITPNCVQLHARREKNSKHKKKNLSTSRLLFAGIAFSMLVLMLFIHASFLF
jgi:hypothetical protein